MKGAARLPAAAAAALALLAAPEPGRADEPLARRLAALKSLVDPGAARAARRAETERPGSCGGGSWWRMTDYGVQARIDTAVHHASIRYAVDPTLVRAVIRTESNYDTDAVSHKGAQGLMQLMPGTADALGVVCPFEPRENVMAGTRYLREMYDRFGTWPRALAAYHAGPRAVERRRLTEVTRRYVRQVIARWRPRLLAWIELD